jgi:hypothetical protein
MPRTTKTVTAGRDSYKFMPPLSMEEETGLRESIREHGVLQPVLADEHGVIIDGYNRARLAEELGVKFQQKIVRGLSEDAKTDLAFRQNMARRNLTSQQKREVIRAYLTVRPDATDRAAGHVLGVHHQTVGNVRAELYPAAPANGENHHKDEPPDGVLASPFYVRSETSGRRPRGRRPDSPAERERKAQARKSVARRTTASARKAKAECAHCCPVHCPPG